MTMESKIALIKIGPFSHINKSVADLLAREFPKSKVDVIDVRDLVNFKGLGNIVATGAEYGAEMICRGKPPGECLEKSSFIFHKIKDRVAKRIGPTEYQFSFQTQSRFDASVPNLPHFVYTDHTHLASLRYPDIERVNLFPERWIRWEKTIYQRATRIFTMSQHVTESLIEDYGIPRTKVTCVYAGSNADVASESSPDKASSGKTILFVGVDWERKGGNDLAQAFVRVREAHPDSRLVIVGCSPNLANLDGCEVIGKVPLDLVAKYFREADVFCLPSRKEPFGIVFVEAMLHGLPIVGTEIGAIPDMVIQNETGVLCPPGDVDAISKALIDLLDDPVRRTRFGKRGQALARDRYTWESVGQKIREAIEQST